MDNKLIMELRNETNLPMMKCKEALLAANGDKAEAITWLRKNGVQATVKFVGRETPNGKIAIALDHGKGSLVLVGCQTDFVANNDIFQTFVKDLANLAIMTDSDTVEKLSNQMINGIPVSVAIVEMIQKLGENLVISKVHLLKGDFVEGYNHGSVASLVSGSGSVDTLHKIALHIVAVSPAPLAIDREHIDQQLIDKETEIILASKDIQNKPDNIKPNIIKGKLNKFFKETALLEQEMLLDALKNETVANYAKRHNVTISDFVRVIV